MMTMAISNVYMHAFLRRKGSIPRADLATLAINVKTVGHLDVLMELYPNFDEWIEELGPAGTLKRLLETDDMQASFARRFHGVRAGLNFEIKCCDKKALGPLLAMGGRCTSRTLWRVVCDSDDVEHARSVWLAMDARERSVFRTKLSTPTGGPDLAMLEFVVSELDAVDRVREMSIAYRWANGRFTVSLARFLLDHRIKDASSVLSEAVACAHFDVTEMIVKHRLCTRTELWECAMSILSMRAAGFTGPIMQHRLDLFRIISCAIVEATHPIGRWLARRRLSRFLSKPL